MTARSNMAVGILAMLITLIGSGSARPLVDAVVHRYTSAHIDLAVQLFICL